MPSIHSIFYAISPIFRRKRMALFFSTFKLDDRTKVLDLGGLPGTWNAQPGDFPVIFLNLQPHPTTNPRFKNLVGNVLSVPFPDRSFDLAFSNSVIEHLGSWENQQIFAREVTRIAPRYWVQTPARSFFIEPHLVAPFIHYLPKALQRLLLRRFTLWGWLAKPTPEQVAHFLAEVRLLNYSEIKSLFPDCKIIKERFFGLTKSYIAIKN
jgi:hypothetical protein